MKQALVLTLAFTLIFPAYCFASPTNNKSQVFPEHSIDGGSVIYDLHLLELGTVTIRNTIAIKIICIF